MKVELDKNNCIGCGACTATCPDKWEMDDSGKSHIINGTLREDGWEEKDITIEEAKEHQEAADSCPVSVINVKE